ncbi:hypothetical protein [Photobacterium damselae]|uniref:hypothetical protein n=1 Tax=Photobacterium damselae TaxID=38293 RepID=UPI001F28F9E8|nr:hypothetical protein [Photobacterium damselae]UKA12962.1 hypothetical protein IHC91_21510 [Photobacterium damselae subsp. damselae]
MTDNKKDLISIPSLLRIEPLGDLESAADKVNDSANRTRDLTLKANEHIALMSFVKDSNKEPRFMSIFEEGRTLPTGNDVEFIITQLNSEYGLNKADIARSIGVSPKGNTTLNRWLTGGEKSPIPYAAWRLLCAYAGYSIDLALTKKKKD